MTLVFTTTFKLLREMNCGPRYEVAELLLLPSLIVAWIQPGKYQENSIGLRIVHTNSQMRPRIHIQVEWELIWIALSSLNDPCVSRSLSEAREADSVDSGGTVNGRIELAGCIMMISRLSPILILFPTTVNLSEIVYLDDKPCGSIAEQNPSSIPHLQKWTHIDPNLRMNPDYRPCSLAE